MAHEFKLKRMVEFHETDLAGIVHFSNFFRYMENAEHAFFRSLGLLIHESEPVAPGEPVLGWPRVHAECDYMRPLRFEDEFEVHVRVLEVKNRALVYEFVFTRLVPGPAEEVARGKVVAACITRDASSKGMKAIPLPKRITDQIQAAPKP